MSGFENETFEGTESADPSEQSARSAFNVLKSLENDPLEQYIKLSKYIKSCRAREAKLVNLCSVQCLDLVKQFSPDLLK